MARTERGTACGRIGAWPCMRPSLDSRIRLRAVQCGSKHRSPRSSPYCSIDPKNACYYTTGCVCSLLTMKKAPLICMICITVLLAGCATLFESEPTTAQGETPDEKMARLDEQVAGLKMEQARLQQECDALSKSIQNMTASNQSQLSDLQHQVQAIDAARESDRKAIIDQLSKRIADMMNGRAASSSGSSASSSQKTQTGYEHVVKSGETLSAIATAYKTSVASIMKANNLKTANSIRVGQKLFIPE
jgi:LysM repeat protein